METDILYLRVFNIINKTINENGKSSDFFKIRDKLVNLFAWAIPNEEAIDEIIKYSPIVEIGAGNGYWASLIKEKGGEIDAYDKNPPKNDNADNINIDNVFFTKTTIIHYPVQKGDESILKQDKYNDYTLLLIWPPMDRTARRCLRYFKGKHVIYIGEDNGGCTANQSFFDSLYLNFNEIKEIKIPQYPYINDKLTIYERK